jgi:ABC-type transport system involved in cytochrome c biogenesis permease subunit
MSKSQLPFEKINYMIMLAGVALIIIGFVIMGLDQEPYGFGFMGLTLGPVIVVTGFAVEFVAIIYKPKSKE